MTPKSKVAGGRPDRAKKRVIAGHVAEDTYDEFKVLAARLGLTTDLALHEALGMFLTAHEVNLPPSLLEKLFLVLERSKHRYRV